MNWFIFQILPECSAKFDGTTDESESGIMGIQSSNAARLTA